MSSRVLITDQSGCELYVQKCRDRFYPLLETNKDNDFEKHLDLIHNLELRPDDVFTVGYAKSGNHWVFEITSMVMNQTTEYSKITLPERFLDSITDDQLAELSSVPSPRLLCTHITEQDTLPKQLTEKKVKTIFLVRNAKDVLVSMHRFVTSLKKYTIYKGKWEDCLDLQMKGQWMYGSWHDHVKNMDNFIRDNPDHPVHIICYESLKQNPVEEIAKLCRFLGKPETLAPAIAKTTIFDTMKDNYQKQDQWKKEVFDDGVPFFHTGTFGKWKNNFTVAQSEMVDSIIEQKLSDSNIGHMVKPYM